MRTALVLGGAACVWDDFERAADLGSYDGVVACNDMGVAWPGRLDAWVSLHPEKMGRWNAARLARGLPPHKRIVGHVNARDSFPRLPECVTDYVDHLFPGQRACGSSGLFALKVALIDLGFDRAALCGVPIEASEAHFFATPAWAQANHYRQGWIEALPQIKARTRSLSGWTADLLGQPTPEFIAGTEDSGPVPRA